MKVNVSPSTRRKGWFDVFVDNIHRVTKRTLKGAESYAKRILDANATRRTENTRRKDKKQEKQIGGGREFVQKEKQESRSVWGGRRSRSRKTRHRGLNPFRVPSATLINNEARKLSKLYNVPISFAEKVLRDVGKDYALAVRKILSQAKKFK